MKLSHKAIEQIKKNVRLRNMLALQLNCSVPTVDRWIRANKDNGDLTKSAAVQVIKEETGLGEDELLSCVAIAEQ